MLSSAKLLFNNRQWASLNQWLYLAIFCVYIYLSLIFSVFLSFSPFDELRVCLAWKSTDFGAIPVLAQPMKKPERTCPSGFLVQIF